MQIIIPMSGSGQRFLDAGYKTPKPLIEVDGRSIIEHVVRLFPGETDFTFICNEEHLAATPMADVLKRIAPSGRIVSIKPHKKGPVFAVVQALDVIRNDDEVIVNYCDFSKSWDYQDFLREVRAKKADGAVSAYRGFHPHMLGTTNYAFMRHDNQWMLAIQEKKPFTANRMNEFASDGTYYFRRGEFVKKYFSRLLDRRIDLNGEFYVSLVYNLLVEDRLKVWIYEIEQMLQWGTPVDLQEYERWSDYFRRVLDWRPPQQTPPAGSLNLIPLAGMGKRFFDRGYTKPKPLIEVNGGPMVIQSAKCLPPAERWTFVCQKTHLTQYPLSDEIRRFIPTANIVALDGMTEGQACTCELGLRGEADRSPLLISSVDQTLIWDSRRYAELMEKEKADCVVWTFRRHLSSKRHPQMYGWVKVDGQDNVLGVSVKVPISDNPFEDHAIVGTFYFREARIFLDAFNALYLNNERVNNEFYVDSCINYVVGRGLKVKNFTVDHYICWGTPDDLMTYEYWQRFFHQCDWHPYNRVGCIKTDAVGKETLNRGG